MRQYRKYDWPELLKAFDDSGLTQTEFCRQHNINPKYFNQKRSKFRASDKGAFTKIDLPSADPQSSLVIQVGRCKIHCPESMPLEAFSSLVHQLA